MNIRIAALPEYIPAAMERIARVFDVISESDPYPCRDSCEVRVYVEVRTRLLTSRSE